jgi:hypothetical protein
MNAATLLAIFIVPVLYVVIQGFAERFRRNPSHAPAPESIPAPRGEA